MADEVDTHPIPTNPRPPPPFYKQGTDSAFIVNSRPQIQHIICNEQ